jgi:hypothetical protein
MLNNVADPHHIDEDPDPDFYLMQKPDPNSHPNPDPSFRIRAQTLAKSTQIGSYSIHFLACLLQIYADPDPA